MTNNGGKAANNLTLELAPEYPFTLVPGDSPTQNLGTINAYQSDSNMQIAKYRVLVDKDAPAGSYELKLKYYEEGSNVVLQKILSVDVGNKESAEIIHIDRTLLVPGKQSGLNFTINNVGNSPLRDLTFSWENPDKVILPVGSDNTRYIKYLGIGGSAELDYQVIADTNAVLGLYQLNLHLTYAQAGNSSAKQISTIAGVYVGGETDFDVALSDSSNGQTSFSVANVGSTPANSVSVIVPVQRGWIVSGSNSVMLGNLNKGDYTVASFKLQSLAGNSTSSGNTNLANRRGMMANAATNTTTTQDRFAQMYNSSAGALAIQIAYTDTMGQRHTVEKEVFVGDSGGLSAGGMSMQAGQRSASSSSSYSYIVAIIVLVAGALIYRQYNKRKNMLASLHLKAHTHEHEKN
ncbi:NPCBM-associated, NEW3 domain of alpha-galactosidase [uncultured archaeon]|nr:NPCBM-associated, NEW3 domain of alpha-galactosidase [uncultured archaeon]